MFSCAFQCPAMDAFKCKNNIFHCPIYAVISNRKVTAKILLESHVLGSLFSSQIEQHGLGAGISLPMHPKVFNYPNRCPAILNRSLTLQILAHFSAFSICHEYLATIDYIPYLAAPSLQSLQSVSHSSKIT